jgi:putative endonuclease
MSRERRSLGEWGERQAEAYLREKGWRILERNIRTPVGEIDLVAQSGRDLVFVEVKTRRSDAFGVPQEAVGLRKQRQILRAAQWYLLQQGKDGFQPRFDVVAVTADGESPRFEHIADAFGA